MDWQLDKQNKQPLHLQIVRFVTAKVQSGEWPAGAKLPPQRQLAAAWQINRSTLQSALGELVAAGVLATRMGSGIWVAAPEAAGQRPPTNWQEYVEQGWQQPNLPTIQEINRLEFDPALIRLGTGELAPELLPGAELQQLWAGQTLPAEAFNYGEPKGLLRLREAVSRYLASQGLTIDPACILITSGALQALQLISQGLLPRRAAMLLEKPSYLFSLRLLHSLRVDLCGLAMDADGLRADTIFAQQRRSQASFLYTIPCFQNPTGRTMSLARRETVLAACQAAKLPILEDDVYRELWLDEPPPPALKALDKAGQVLYLGSLSKWLCPGLRIGWIAGPEPVISRLADSKMQYDYGSSALSQEAAAAWLESEALPRHLTHLRQALRLRRQHMLDLLTRYFSKLAVWERPAGGFYVWLQLKQPVAMPRLFKEALYGGVLLNPGYLYEPGDAAHLRLSYAYAAPAELEEGMARLAQILAAHYRAD